MAQKLTDWLRHPCCLWGPGLLLSGEHSQKCPESGRMGYATLAIWGVPNASHRLGDKISTAPQMCRLVESPPPPGGSPTPQSGGPNHWWPTSGQIGYITRAAGGVSNASERETKSAVAH